MNIEKKIKSFLKESFDGEWAKNISSELKAYKLQIGIKSIEGEADEDEGDFTVVLDNGDEMTFTWNTDYTGKKKDVFEIFVKNSIGKKIFKLESDEVDSFSYMISHYWRKSYNWKD